MKKTIVMAILSLANLSYAGAQNSLIPLQTQPPAIITPYELQGIGNFDQRKRYIDYEYQQRLRDMQQYQQQQEIIEELKRLNEKND